MRSNMRSKCDWTIKTSIQQWGWTAIEQNGDIKWGPETVMEKMATKVKHWDNNNNNIGQGYQF